MAWVYSIMVLVGTALAVLVPGPSAEAGEKLVLAGLEKPVKVLTDKLGVPHVYAKSDHDVFFAQGYLHARDRFFQMDANRRAASGALAELTGSFADLFDDAQARVLGLRLAAQRSLDLLEPRELAATQVYADGVNAWLAAGTLPVEYADLEVTRAGIPPWTVLDTLTMAKAGTPDVRISETLDTDRLQGYVDALGAAAGAALYYEDVARFAPMTPRATLPDALGLLPLTVARPSSGPEARAPRNGAALARRFVARAAQLPGLDRALRRRDPGLGSNIWGVAAAHSANGRPLLAADGHSPLTAPGEQYEIHLVVENDPVAGPLNVSGVNSPGIPGVVSIGQNARVAWSWTSLYHDVSDVFEDRLVRGDPGCPAPLCIDSAGALHPVERRAESYRLNQVDGIPDNAADFTASVAGFVPQAVDVLSVPFRSFGPILELEDPSVVDGPATETSVLTLQYTGLHGTREAAGLFAFQRARDVFEFREGVKQWTAALANFVVADVDGNLAYFSSGEVPLRADLEAGALSGAPPWLVRDGSGPANWIPDPAHTQGQVLPFAVVPFDEMPHVVNPPAGFIVNANEDPSGNVLDNDALNQTRPSNATAILYLGNASTQGLRNGRATALLLEKIDARETLSLEDMQRIQANTQALDAELLAPFVVAAFEAAEQPGAPADLAVFSGDPDLAEAVDRFRSWDYSSPTGIPEGYDASDVEGERSPEVSEAEAAASVATTLFAVWRWKLIVNQVHTPLAALGLAPAYAQGSETGLHHLLSQVPFTGVGASDIDFFPEPAALAAEDRRDVALLQALRETLDLLASPVYAPVFGGSARQDDYRWGKLHRVTFEHLLGGDYSIPPAAGFTDLAPGLTGISRDGAHDTLNPGLHGAGDTPGAMRFSAGATERLVVSPRRATASGAGMRGFASLQGGSSGDPASPLYASQLGKWLTVDYHAVPMSKKEVRRRRHTTERFVPAKAKTAGKAEGAAPAPQ